VTVADTKYGEVDKKLEKPATSQSGIPAIDRLRDGLTYNPDEVHYVAEHFIDIPEKNKFQNTVEDSKMFSTDEVSFIKTKKLNLQNKPTQVDSKVNSTVHQVDVSETTRETTRETTLITIDTNYQAILFESKNDTKPNAQDTHPEQTKSSESQRYEPKTNEKIAEKTNPELRTNRTPDVKDEKSETKQNNENRILLRPKLKDYTDLLKKVVLMSITKLRSIISNFFHKK